MLFDYDNKNEKSILEYASKLEGLTFREIIYAYKSYCAINGIDYDKEKLSVLETNAKGQLGGLIEKYYFGYEPNSDQQADFNDVGIELKQTPLDLTSKNKYRAGERLSITNISYNEPVIENFYDSHVWEKINKILLVQYLRDKSKDRLDYEIKKVSLYEPTTEDLKIIIDDYNKINEYLKAGKAHELSEGMTTYLGACTKGSTANDSWRPQYYGDKIPAKKRNYCLKQSYMNYLVNERLFKETESIITNSELLKNQTFEELIVERINHYIGKTDLELCEKFSVDYKKDKQLWATLAYRMLGIKSNKASEFVKANIIVKAIRIEENNKIKEHMSFPHIKFKELLEDEWEDSWPYNYFEQTRFLFVIYKKIDGRYTLLGSQMWNMPTDILNTKIKECWECVRNVLKEGVVLTKTNNGIKNNFPGKDFNGITHLRPHASKSAYLLEDGTIIGNIETDADELPDGRMMTKQCFWLNNTYIYDQLKYK